MSVRRRRGVSTGESFATGGSAACIETLLTAWYIDLPIYSDPAGSAACGRFRMDLAKARENVERRDDFGRTNLFRPKLVAGVISFIRSPYLGRHCLGQAA